MIRGTRAIKVIPALPEKQALQEKPVLSALQDLRDKTVFAPAGFMPRLTHPVFYFKEIKLIHILAKN